MPFAGGIALIAIGAILAFALSDTSVGGVDLQVVGVIVMLAGAAALLLPLLVGNRLRARPVWGRWVGRSRQDVLDREKQFLVDPADYDPVVDPLNDGRRTPDGRS
jgi:Domain of unknown function (DUF6458)